jgi:hypothetical protein
MVSRAENRSDVEEADAWLRAHVGLYGNPMVLTTSQATRFSQIGLDVEALKRDGVVIIAAPIPTGPEAN